MARRNGKPGDYLFSDYYTGFTTYRSKVKEDYWNSWAVKPLLRNLQEIAKPLLDPYPVDQYSGPTYEQTTACQFELQPLYIGNTNILTPNNSATYILGLNPPIGEASVGCTFRVS